jgi:prepilin-type N-terminal cleavage/methylation domain-containing protein
MKIYSPPINRAENRPGKGFTLIEMIGVLAVIAILAAVLIPKVYQAINDSRVSGASMTCNTVKTAIADHYAKAGTLQAQVAQNGTITPLTIPVVNYDQILLTEGFLDKPFAVKIGDGSVTNMVKLVSLNGLTNGPVDGTELTGFALAGGGTNQVIGSACAMAIISGVLETDAKDLNDRIDGPSLGVALGSAPDINGRVKYALPVNGVTTVYVYLTHR